MAQNRRRENPNRNQSRPAQGNTARRRSRSNASGRRRVYDQAQDARRASSQRRGSPQGYQEQTIDFANGSVRYEQPRRADNSIQFPRQGRQMSGSAGQNGAGRSRSAQDRARGRNGNSSTRPANGASRGAKNGPSGRMRPTEANLRSPSRRESKKKRKLTRAAIRRRRIIRRLTAFALLLCVIAAGVYLTVTMLFKISSIQVQTADGTQVAEVGGYASEQILQALGVHTEENIFSFDPGQKSKELEEAFPMLEFIHVERQYPGTVVVQVTEARPTYAMQVEGGWLTLSASLKILSKDAAQPSGPCHPLRRGAGVYHARRTAGLCRGPRRQQCGRFRECRQRGFFGNRGGDRPTAGIAQHPDVRTGQLRDAGRRHPHGVCGHRGNGLFVSGPHQRPAGHAE